MIQFKCAGVTFKHATASMPFNEIAKTIQAAYKRKKKLLKAIEVSKTLSSLKKAQHHYASSPLVKLTYFLDLAKEQSPQPINTFEHYMTLAEKTDLFSPITENVSVHGKITGSGNSARFYCSFKAKHKVGQKIISDLISKQFVPKSFQYNSSGKGIHKAVAKIKKLVAEGYNCVLRLDIKKFFDSFEHKALQKTLPLDKALLEHCAIGKYYCTELIAKNTSEMFYSAMSKYSQLVKQTGIPLGSSASQVIANYYISKLDVKLPKDAIFINYVDDFLVLAKSNDSAVAVHKALQLALTNLSVGDFELLEKTSSSTPPGFTFLGHEFCFDNEGSLKIAVSLKNINKIYHFVNTEPHKIIDGINQINKYEDKEAFKLAKVISYAKHIYGKRSV